MLIVKPHQEGVAADKLKYRLVVDHRDINALTIPQHHRIPNITTIYSQLGGARVLSLLDLSKAFHQENNADDDGPPGYTSVNKTAFSTEFGHFEFVGCVMGCTNTPSYFQNQVKTKLRKAGLVNVGMLGLSADGTVYEHKGNACVSPYIDDLIVCTKDHIKIGTTRKFTPKYTLNLGKETGC